jgi:predicted DNA-binding transcriptional regulator YafY
VRLGDGLLVTVHAPADEIAKRLPWGAGALEPIDPHHYEYRTSDDNLEWLALRVAMLGADVDVHEPPELIAQLNVLARRLQRAADDGD